VTSLRCALALVLAGLAAACASEGGPAMSRPPVSRPESLRVRLSDDSITRVPLEDYVEATALSEYTPASVGSELAERMYEVQTVIARTYALGHLSRHGREGFDLCSSTHCQLYQPGRLKTSSWVASSAAATKRTAGQVLWYERGVAETLFHADCGGWLSDANEVWGGTARPYLIASPDGGPAERAHASWTFEVEAARLGAALNTDVRTAVGDRLVDIAILQRDRSGRASLVALRGTREPLVRGEELRSIVSRELGARSLRSTWFTVTRSGTRFVFTGRGYGHGVGLCQAGALARLKAGWPVQQVLAQYYPGTALRTVR
jgi:stage II sporulation protein D